MGGVKNQRAFTLIELLVIIAIIAFLATAAFAFLNNSREKARIAGAQNDLAQLRIAVDRLVLDTGLYPKKLNPTPCYQDPDGFVDQCDIGILCTDGGFPNWQGPYMTNIPLDPWGTKYYFDSDYWCFNFVKGCEGVPNETWLRALVSFGPNKSETYNDGDNIVLILCRD